MTELELELDKVDLEDDDFDQVLLLTEEETR